MFSGKALLTMSSHLQSSEFTYLIPYLHPVAQQIQEKAGSAVCVETQDGICERTDQKPTVLSVKSKRFFRVFGIFEGPQSFSSYSSRSWEKTKPVLRITLLQCVFMMRMETCSLPEGEENI